MMRSAAGHREPKRIVFNVGSEAIRPLYRDFEYDARLAIDNNCGGDQRYNLQGRFERPELWKSPRHGIHVEDLCFITNVVLQRQPDGDHVTWELDGEWERISSATVSLYLQQLHGPDVWRDSAQLADAVPANSGAAKVSLADCRGKRFRIIVRRDGDPETGGVSAEFDGG